MRVLAAALESVPYTFDELPLHELTGIAGYQRQLDEYWVQCIVRDFAWSRFKPVTVSWRDDGFFIIDGQHRVEAARRLGYGKWKIPVVVYIGLTEGQEAKLFVELNRDQKRPNKRQELSAALAYNDPEAVAIKQIVEGCGYRLNLGTGRNVGGRTIGSVGTLMMIHSWGAGTLQRTLQALADAYGVNAEPSGQMIHGLASFISRYRTLYDHDVLVRKMRDETAAAVEAQGTSIKRMFGGTVWDGTGRYILKLYNTKLRTTRLPEWNEMRQRGSGRKAGVKARRE